MKDGQFEAILKSFSRKDLPDSEVEFVGEIPADTIAPYRQRALEELAKEVEQPGFRKGKVPHDLVLKKIGEVAVLEEATNLFVRKFYPELVEAHQLDAVGRPDIRITKLAPGTPVGLTIRTALYPAVTLPRNWQTIGEGVVMETVAPATEEEVAGTLESLRQARKKKKEDGTEEVPELNDEFAKSVGAFETLEALKEQMRKGITEEKTRQARDKRRGAIIDKLVEKTEVKVPRIFVESELEKIISQLKEDVTRFGLTFEGYLQQSGKTEDVLRQDFRAQALKRAKLQLALNKIAEEEKIEADRQAVEHEMKHALEHFPNANPELLGVHISTVLRNEKVLQLLEGSTNKESATA
jgi:FKBP-type peptidyl-prolyl cis-trans isomerase (trigger factor)